MFGARDHFYRSSDQPLRQGGAMISALSAGRSEAEREALGATLDPRTPVIDQQFWAELGDRAPRALNRYMSLAEAIAKAGDAALFKGICSRRELFHDVPAHEDRDIRLQHPDLTIAEACGFEALAMGRMELLGILQDAALAYQASSTKEEARAASPWSGHDLAQAYLRPSSKSIEASAIALARSESMSAEQLADGLAWLAKRAAMDEEQGRGFHIASLPVADMVLDVAVQYGCRLPARAALAAGAVATRGTAKQCAANGDFELAQSLARSCVAKRKAKAREAAWRRDEEKNDPAGVCQEMAHSHLSSLDAIAKAVLEPREDSGSREVTWAQFEDGREEIRQAQKLALSGAFDTAFDDPKRAALGKQGIASAWRALALLDKDTAASRAEAEALAPGAPTTYEEARFRAWMGDPGLAGAMASLPSKDVAKLAGAMATRLAECRRWSVEASKGQNSRRGEIIERQIKHLDESLYQAWDGSGHLERADKAELDAVVAKAGLTIEYERRALAAAVDSPEPGRRRGPLRA